MSIANDLRSIVSDAREYILREEFRVRELLNHNFKKARYFKSGSSMVVLEDDCIVTSHLAEAAHRWLKLPGLKAGDS